MKECIYTTKDEAAKKARINELIAKNAEFTLADFGGAPSKMISNYDKPKEYPRAERPRVFLTGDMIPKIKAALDDPEYVNVTRAFWERANTEYYTPHVYRTVYRDHNEIELPENIKEKLPLKFDGTFLPLEITGTTYNWDGRILPTIEAKALAYLLTGDELYGREAILFVKNAIRTLRFTKDLFIDPFRAFSYNMLVAAEVYDWCNALLTDDDKEQIISGCEHYLCLWDPENGIHNMEIGFPPAAGSGVSGHTISVMLLRDYLAMAASIYEDHPDWWEFCAGKYYQQFVEPANIAFQGGLTSQGTVCYCHNKFYTFLTSAWVMKNATGKMPYDPAMGNVMSSILGHMLPNGRLFETGDGSRSGNGANPYGEDVWNMPNMFFSSALFPDRAVQANAKYYSHNYTRFSYFFNTLSESMLLILCANSVKPAEDRFAAIPMVTYNPYPYGQLISHNSWEADGAASFMKIGVFTSANHDHHDSGTFMLYYKSLLLTSSGIYNCYGNSHHYFYHQSTIGHNGLLVYNPAMRDPSSNRDGNFDQRYKYWYSGSQRILPEPASIEQWLGGDYDLGEVTGYASDYQGAGKAPTYTYIAGDITKAYDTVNTVDLVERRMLTVYTENKECPMLFFTYDKISAKKPEFKKSYLLHTTAEPEINGSTMTFAKGGGRLVFNAIKGADKMEKIGGEGRAFEINGENCLAVHLSSGEVAPENVDNIWGRVEISSDSSKDHEFFNAMYVTDEDNTEIEKPLSYENADVVAASNLGACAVFVRSSQRASGILEFESSSDTDKYFVSGVSAGEWSISVNGKLCGTATASEASGLLVFKAPFGKVKLVKNQ